MSRYVEDGPPRMYEIFETEEFDKVLKRLPPQDAAFLRKKLDNYMYPQLRNEPHFGQNIRKLVNYSPETWRCRIGRYRVFYTMDEDENTVFILTVDLRRDAYR